MICSVDRKIIMGMDRAHSAHHGREVKDGMRAAYSALTSGGVANIANDFLVADRSVERRALGYIDNADAVTISVQACRNMRALFSVNIGGTHIVWRGTYDEAVSSSDDEEISVIFAHVESNM